MSESIEKGLFCKEKLQAYVKRMVDFGPRLTGSKAHNDYINLLETELENMGYDVYSDTLSFKRWEPKGFALSYCDNGEENSVNQEDISYYPYSGFTPEEGITAQMCYCGPLSMFVGSTNKIAVIRMSLFEAGCGLIFKKRATYPYDYEPPQKQGSPVVATFVASPFLEIAKAVGAKAVICIMSGCSDDLARYQYLPFIKTYQGIPALWVNETVGLKIEEAAKRGEKATLTLKAELHNNNPTRTIFAVLKGKSTDESILVNTHTDGTNAFEENAGIGLLSLAKYFSEKPIEEREKTIVFSFITGHFQLKQFGDALNQATTKFLNSHREYWDGRNGHYKAVVGLTLEHLGCSEWGDDETKTHYEKKSDVDHELIYTSNEILAKLYLDAVEGRKYTKSLLLWPKNFVHFGEGQPIYKKGIPSIALCPGPDYLCNIAPDGYIDRLNFDMMFEQIDTFRKLIEVIDKKTRKELGKNQPFWLGFRWN